MDNFLIFKVKFTSLILRLVTKAINSITSYFQHHLFDFFNYSQLVLLEERNHHRELIQFDSKNHVHFLNKYLLNLPYHS